MLHLEKVDFVDIATVILTYFNAFFEGLMSNVLVGECLNALGS